MIFVLNWVQYYTDRPDGVEQSLYKPKYWTLWFISQQVFVGYD